MLAHRIKLSPETFWNITPWQFGLLVDASVKQKEDDHDHWAWLMYHNAVIPMMKRTPLLDRFLSRAKKPVKGFDENAMLTFLKGYQAKRDKDGTNSKTDG